MSDSTEVEYTLTINTEMISGDVRKLEVSLMRILSYIQQLTGGNVELAKLITAIQKVIITIRSLQMAIRAAQLATGPIGWLYFGTTLVATAMSGYSMYESLAGM